MWVFRDERQRLDVAVHVRKTLGGDAFHVEGLDGEHLFVVEDLGFGERVVTRDGVGEAVQEFGEIKLGEVTLDVGGRDGECLAFGGGLGRAFWACGDFDGELGGFTTELGG